MLVFLEYFIFEEGRHVLQTENDGLIVSRMQQESLLSAPLCSL